MNILVNEVSLWAYKYPNIDNINDDSIDKLLDKEYVEMKLYYNNFNGNAKNLQEIRDYINNNNDIRLFSTHKIYVSNLNEGIKYLGLYFMDGNNWDTHICEKIKIANSVLWVLNNKQLFMFGIELKIGNLLITSLIRSVISYGLEIFYPNSKLRSKLNTCINRGIRLVTNVYKSTSSALMRIIIGIPLMDAWNEKMRLNYYFRLRIKIYNSFANQLFNLSFKNFNEKYNIDFNDYLNIKIPINPIKTIAGEYWTLLNKYSLRKYWDITKLRELNANQWKKIIQTKVINNAYKKDLNTIKNSKLSSDFYKINENIFNDYNTYTVNTMLGSEIDMVFNEYSK